MADLNIVQHLIPHLDRHMVLPILEFFQEKETFDATDLQRAKLELVSATKMIDFAEEEYKALNNTDTVPTDMEKNREQVYEQLKAGDDATADIMDLIKNRGLLDELRDSNPFFVKEAHKINDDVVLQLYHHAKLTYDVGQYEDASLMLQAFRLLTKDDDLSFKALWGKLAADLLMANAEASLEDLNALKEAIDARVFVDQLEQLQQRTWLVHWSLFLFFKMHEDGPSMMIDFILKDDRLLNAVQINCPHILRYLTAAVITDPRRKFSLNDFVKVLKQEKQYSDPLTRFLMSVYVEFDFDVAAQGLAECEDVIGNDFFLLYMSKSETNIFEQQARLLIFETICRIHNYIDIDVLSRYIGLNTDGAEAKANERVIVDLIRQSRIDAKIDSDHNRLVMGTNYPSVYQQVIDKTKSLAYRTNQLALQVEKKFQMLAGVES